MSCLTLPISASLERARRVATMNGGDRCRLAMTFGQRVANLEPRLASPPAERDNPFRLVSGADPRRKRLPNAGADRAPQYFYPTGFPVMPQYNRARGSDAGSRSPPNLAASKQRKLSPFFWHIPQELRNDGPFVLYKYVQHDFDLLALPRINPVSSNKHCRSRRCGQAGASVHGALGRAAKKEEAAAALQITGVSVVAPRAKRF
jgi:hypothetical protein